MKNKTLSILGVILGVSALGLTVMQIHAAGTVTVSPSNMNGWGFVDETTSSTGIAFGTMVTGPSTPPAGVGSARLLVNDTGGEILATINFAGTKLSTITNLQYSTYRKVGAVALAPSLQFAFDDDVTDATNTYRGRMTYEPYFTQTVNSGSWQTWDTRESTGTGNWWFSNSAAFGNNCPQSNPCTWNEVLALYPNAGIRNSVGEFDFKAGSGWTGDFDGNVDKLVMGISGSDTTYDFEPDVAPTPTPTVTVTPTVIPTVTVTPTVTPSVTPTGLPIPSACAGMVFSNTIVGTTKSEQLKGTSGNDLIYGMGGSDQIDGKGGNDCIVGGNSSDQLIGGPGNDVLLGGNGSDNLDGGQGTDKLYGEDGSDVLYGGADNDMLDGGNGSDAAIGGAGNADSCTAESKSQCEL